MELQASRSRARLGPAGEPILLLDQDRARWDRLLIRRGLAALARAEALARPLGPYTLQAAIAACHARAKVATDTDWKRIVALYDALTELTPSPVVELNRAVAVSMAFGPAAGLELVDALTAEPALRSYHLFAERARRPARQAGQCRRPAGSSSVPPGSPATPANGPSCSTVPRAPRAAPTDRRPPRRLARAAG